MSDEMKVLNDAEVSGVSGGGAAHANGQFWNDGDAIYYRIAPGDYLDNIAKYFGTTSYAIKQLNPGVIKNVDLIQAYAVIRIR